jgi:hypothetical protein
VQLDTAPWARTTPSSVQETVPVDPRSGRALRGC